MPVRWWMTRKIGENIISKNWVSQQNEESGWDIAGTLLRLLHRDWNVWEERNKRDSRYAAFYAVVCNWDLIWQAVGLGKCFLDSHKCYCEYLTGQIHGRMVPTSSLLGCSMLSSFSDSFGQATATVSSPWLAQCHLFPGLLSRLGMALVWPSSHNRDCWPHLAQKHFGMQSDWLGSCVVTDQTVLNREIQNSR